MDSGCLDEGEELEEDYDVLRELLPGEVVGIMDQLLRAEVCINILNTLLKVVLTPVFLGSILHGSSSSTNTVFFNIY